MRCSVGGDAHAVERSGTSTLGVHRPVCHRTPCTPRRGGRLCPPAIIRTHPRCSSVGGDALIAPYATAPLAPLRRGRCPRSGAKRNKHPWGASPRRARRRDPPKPPSLPCHSEPVTDVTGVGIRLPPPRRSAELPPPSVRWQREALTEGETLHARTPCTPL